MQALHLPKWVLRSAAIGFLAAPVIACCASIAANVIYSSQFGYSAMAISAASEVARITIMIVVVLLAGWTWQLRFMILLVGSYSAWTATHVAMDERFQTMFGRAEKVATYSDNKAEIARMARDLSQITEVSTSAALQGQISVLNDRISTLSENIKDESDPKKSGPCKGRCQTYKTELDTSQVELAKLQDRLGAAQKREQLEQSIAVARDKRDTETATVKMSGSAELLNYVGRVKQNKTDFAELLINTLFYLLLVEGMSYLLVPAMRALITVNRMPDEKKEEVEIAKVEEPKVEETEAEEPKTMEALVAEIITVQPEAIKPLRRRNKNGKFSKRPGPKPKNLPKLKLRDLPRPAGKNVIDIGSRHKDFGKKDD